MEAHSAVPFCRCCPFLCGLALISTCFWAVTPKLGLHRTLLVQTRASLLYSSWPICAGTNAGTSLLRHSRVCTQRHTDTHRRRDTPSRNQHRREGPITTASPFSFPLLSAVCCLVSGVWCLVSRKMHTQDSAVSRRVHPSALPCVQANFAKLNCSQESARALDCYALDCCVQLTVCFHLGSYGLRS